MNKTKNTLRNPGKTTITFFISVFLLLSVSIGVFAQESETSGDAYLKEKDAVFLVNQAIYLDAEKVGNLELFKKLEEALGKKVLNQYIPISSGTAFLINGDGSLITAAHVVRYLPDEKKNDYALWSFLQYVSKNILPGYMSQRELHFACAEYLKLVRASNVVISVKSTAKKDYAARVVGQNDGLDLALLKIDLDEKIEPITVGGDVEFSVGDAVMTIGYPLPFIMDQFLDDFKPTITNGIISAIRNDAWDIQHTASINPGNSGGPLLAKDGRLIGVNVGTITQANNIYFSTNSKKLINWLKQIGQAELINEK